MLSNIIVPAESLGGILLGEEVQGVVDRLSATDEVERVNQSTVEINGSETAIYHDPESGRIESLSCGKKFRGNFMGKLWPGMSVGDVLKNTETQIAWCGFVQVDGIKGIGLSLPGELDDFERLTDFLSAEFVFDKLWVYSF
ncbi:TPA: hypothetical protein QDC27_000806 [Burkholderia cepacia ATCC 25416]|nr:hypothetical protein [Burkholderia cepacia ATCC 25416]HDR9773085.1 hypothetical protein [Burkholderia cepacia ATCC 25416]HDR9781825.1 hypothetical protein [Burkholderia cepacia ATCC 25416]HDR9791456.1 hypothetical protein [Burkholderia cepacia ATCC 25416]